MASVNRFLAKVIQLFLTKPLTQFSFLRCSPQGVAKVPPPSRALFDIWLTMQIPQKRCPDKPCHTWDMCDICMTAAKRELCDFLTECVGQLADGSHTHTHTHTRAELTDHTSCRVSRPFHIICSLAKRKFNVYLTLLYSKKKLIIWKLDSVLGCALFPTNLQCFSSANGF